MSGPARDARLLGVRELRSDRVGFALRQLAEDLVTERRRVLQLERENRELRAELELLRHSPAEQSRRSPDRDASFAAPQAA